MSRPEPTIILSQTDPATGENWQVLAAEHSYIITYKGQPINLRTEQTLLGWNQRKYKKTGYSNLGTCLAQVRRLNEIFNCEDFGYAEWSA